MKRYNIFKNLRKQHQDILEFADELNTLAGAEAANFDSGNIRAALNQLRRELESHLKLEDELLYPLLAKNNKKEIRNTARMFSVEFNNLMEVFLKYDARWSLDASIANHRDDFSSDSKAVVTALLRDTRHLLEALRDELLEKDELVEREIVDVLDKARERYGATVDLTKV